MPPPLIHRLETWQGKHFAVIASGRGSKELTFCLTVASSDSSWYIITESGRSWLVWITADHGRYRFNWRSDNRALLSWYPLDLCRNSCLLGDEKRVFCTFSSCSSWSGSAHNRSSLGSKIRVSWLAFEPHLFGAARHLIKVGCSRCGAVRYSISKPNLVTLSQAVSLPLSWWNDNRTLEKTQPWLLQLYSREVCYQHSLFVQCPPIPVYLSFVDDQHDS